MMVQESEVGATCFTWSCWAVKAFLLASAEWEGMVHSMQQVSTGVTNSKCTHGIL